MAGAFKARQIIEEKQFEEEKNRLYRSTKRLDEILYGVTWILARRPESFERVAGLDLFLAKTDAFPNHPAFYIWFAFDADAVYLLSIEKVPSVE